MAPLHDIFSLVCGQEHNWVVAGSGLPFCQRCTGLYVGAVVAFLANLLFRPRPTAAMLWTHGMFLLLMVPFGYHLVPQTSELRMLTGMLFAFGLVYYMTLLIRDRRPKWNDPMIRSTPGYFLVSLLLFVLMTAAVQWGGARTNFVLSWVGFGGLLIYGALVLGNVLLLAVAAKELLGGRASPEDS